MKCNDKKTPSSPPKSRNRKGITAMLVLGPLNTSVDITIRKIENTQPKIPEITRNTSLTDPKLISTTSFVMSKIWATLDLTVRIFFVIDRKKQKKFFA